MHKNQNKKNAYFFHWFTGAKILILWNIFILFMSPYMVNIIRTVWISSLVAVLVIYSCLVGVLVIYPWVINNYAVV